MNQGKLVFSQVMAYLPLSTFRRCLSTHRGEHKVKDFSCLDQFLAMAFAHLTYRESLRDIEGNLRAQAKRLYHRDEDRRDILRAVDPRHTPGVATTRSPAHDGACGSTRAAIRFMPSHDHRFIRLRHTNESTDKRPAPNKAMTTANTPHRWWSFSAAGLRSP